MINAIIVAFSVALYCFCMYAMIASDETKTHDQAMIVIGLYTILLLIYYVL